MHTRFFSWKQNLDGLDKFLNYLSTFPDVWIMTVGQAIQWIQDPTSVMSLDEFGPWNCTEYMAERPDLRCTAPHSCKYKIGEWTERWMPTCTPCPPNYPWVGNPEGAYL